MTWTPYIHIQTLLKKRCRKGIPDSMRGAAWVFLLRDELPRPAHPTYADLLDMQVTVQLIWTANIRSDGPHLTWRPSTAPSRVHRIF